MSNITLKILAQQLNLSTAAVSKALRDSHEISEVTKQRVLALANSLNYVPHPYAGSLRVKRTRTIAVVIPEVADSFFSLALNGIESVAIEKGYHALFYLTHENLEREKEILYGLGFGRVDGVIMSATMKTTVYDHIKELHAKIPLVLFDRVGDELEIANVTTNDEECGYLATRHLIQQGCKHIAFLSISNSLSICKKRMIGYQKALSDDQIDIDSSLVVEYGDEHGKNYLTIKKLLERPDRPDGIVATVSKMATDIYHASLELGIPIPEQLKVVCFSTEPTVGIFNPSLTTITQPAFDMGEHAAKILFKALAGKKWVSNEESRIISSELIIRHSTK